VPARILLVGLLAAAALTAPLGFQPVRAAGGTVSTVGALEAWTKVNACFPNQTYWDGSNDPDPGKFGAVKAGRTPQNSGDPCSGIIWRSMLRMNTAGVAGKTILRATFNAFETFAPACNPEPVDLWWTDSISTSTDWNTQGWIQKVASWSGAHGWPGSPCAARAWVVFDVTAIMARIAAGGGTSLTLGLRAPNESVCHSNSSGNTCQWKRFDSGAIVAGDAPFLSIQYV
jgi:hypothetical protein